ncbi:LAGLIDADG DNA endonuclease family protein [Andreesenia angusta]|uniref:LAGLIDADG DNA endonuclease family protein n=1 Tax=Andreesenia angusta TaxID=39480 RepID=A0A1S1V554_9FIRM|nr:hypothetical protein [Andreesenia angusta]OHW61565.1 LAGLIDADG DNA endonuclease family protein [Andreesenia angusta]
MNQIERNILVGSLLGDGCLSIHGRSINARYREHGCEKQDGYRKWKAKMLKNLGFQFSDRGKYGNVYSPSREEFTDLYNLFYVDGVKTLTDENISLLDHPVGLACLYMDDGTLVMDTSRKKSSIYTFPRISIYTLCFSKHENQLLADHIEKVFKVDFKLKKHPDGKNYLLELNKAREVVKFIEIVKPYVNEVDCMKYKVTLEARLEAKLLDLKRSHPDKSITKSSLSPIDKTYSAEDEELIISMKQSGCTDKEIAYALGRSYWGLVDKIRRMKKEGKMP